jgi:hypothetical protein
VSSTVTVAVNNAPDPGASGTLTVCNSGAIEDLFDALLGTPDVGGSWTGPGNQVVNGFFDPTTDIGGIYTYTVQGIIPCPSSSATVSVNVIGVPDPGTDNILNLCYIGPNVQLFGALGGTPDLGGAWTAPNGSPTNGSFDPTTSSPGDYVYTVAGTPPCPSASATVTVNVLVNPDAGNDGSLLICGNDNPTDLFYSLQGTPDPGGDWYDPNGNLLSALFDPSSDPAGNYIYVLTVPLPCVGDTAFVDVSITTPPDAGISDTIVICENDPAFDMFGLLGGTPDSSGSWTKPNGASHSNMFDPALDSPGSYGYTVSGMNPCPNATSFITVVVERLPDAGSDGSVNVCPENPAFDLYPILGGTPDTGGVWTGPSGNVFSGFYDPASDPQGIYTYTVNFTTSCPNASASATVTIYNVSPPDAGLDSVSCSLAFQMNPSGSWTSGTWSGPSGVVFDDAMLPNANVSVPTGPS